MSTLLVVACHQVYDKSFLLSGKLPSKNAAPLQPAITGHPSRPVTIRELGHSSIARAFVCTWSTDPTLCTRHGFINGKDGETTMNNKTAKASNFWFTGLASMLLLTGCEPPEEELANRYGFAAKDCSRWRCGYNTSEINGKSLQELNLDGQPNADGVKLVGFVPTQGLLSCLLFGCHLDTDGDELVATNGFTELRGFQLVGSTLLVRVQQGLVLPVVIAGYEEVDSWADPGTSVAAYSLIYVDPESLLDTSICKGTLVDPLQASVVILAGERYDLETKTVHSGQDGWFTLACAGSAAAKMSLMGYGPNADFNGEGEPATPQQRQATLKMITADYCGNGDSYTADGTPLNWRNAAGSVGFPNPEESQIEAIWTAQGAVCLDAPRVVSLEDVECSIPSCDSIDLAGHEWATYLVEDES